MSHAEPTQPALPGTGDAGSSSSESTGVPMPLAAHGDAAFQPGPVLWWVLHVVASGGAWAATERHRHVHRKEAGTRKGPLKNANFSSPTVVSAVLGSAPPKVTRTACPCNRKGDGGTWRPHHCWGGSSMLGSLKGLCGIMLQQRDVREEGWRPQSMVSLKASKFIFHSTAAEMKRAASGREGKRS